MNLPEVKNQQKLGKLGESLAAKYLQKCGYSIIERNFRIRYGEIDLIARDGDTLVFVEVKTRKNTQFGLPEEAITPRKLHELIQTAAFYNARYNTHSIKQRMDLVAIRMDNNNQVEYLKHIQNISS